MHVSSTAGLSSSVYSSSGPGAQAEDRASPANPPTVPVVPQISQAVELSLPIDALLHLSATGTSDLSNANAAYHQKFFPGREGFDTGALARSVADPGLVSSSAGKPLVEVATDARSAMDAKYAQMNESGEPFKPDSPEARDWYTLMGELDRRSLLAIRENVGGLFDAAEQAQAKWIMQQQQTLAMGHYSGPTSQEEAFHDPFGADDVSRFKAAGAWLDSVSPEEKRSGEWMQQRTAIEVNLQRVLDESEEPELELMSLAEVLNESDRRQAEQEQLHGPGPVATQPPRGDGHSTEHRPERLAGLEAELAALKKNQLSMPIPEYLRAKFTLQDQITSERLAAGEDLHVLRVRYEGKVYKIGGKSLGRGEDLIKSGALQMAQVATPKLSRWA